MPSRKPQKITFLLNQLYGSNIMSGGETRAQSILNYYAKDKNYKVKIIAPKGSHHNFKNTPLIDSSSQFLENLNLNPKLHILILFIYRTFKSLTLSHESDIIYSTGDFFCNSIPSYYYKLKNPKIKVISLIHHLNPSPQNRPSNPFLTSLFSHYSQKLSLYLIKKSSDLIFVMNQEVKDQLQKKGLQNVHIIGNGLDLTAIKKTPPAKRRKKQIIFFGRLNHSKGALDLPYIIKNTLKTFPDYHFHLIGHLDPNLRFPNLKNTTIHGFLEKKSDVYRYLKDSQAYILPSYEEGWSIATFEAAACQTPILCYQLPVFKELFNDSIHYAKYGNKQDFAKKLKILIKDRKKATIKQMQQAAYQISQQYSWQNIYKKEITLINKL